MAKKKQKWYVVWKGRNPGIYDTWDECSEQVYRYGGAQYKSYTSRLDAERNFQNAYYVVWHGKEPGIYQGWESCREQIEGFEDSEYKSFEHFERAQKAFDNWEGGSGETIDSLSTAEQNHIRSILSEPSFAEPGKTRQELLIEVLPILESIAVDAACSGNPGLVEYRGVQTETKRELFKQGPFPGGTNNIGEFLALVHGLAFLKREGMSVPVYSDSKVAIKWVRIKKCKTDLEQTKQNKELFDLIERAENWLAKNEYENQILRWDTELWGEIPADFGRK